MKFCQLFRIALTTALAVLSTLCDAQVTLTIDGKPVNKATIVISMGDMPPIEPPKCTPPATWNGSECVAPLPPPAGCTQADAPTQLGGNPPIPATPMGATQVIAYRIAADLLDNKWVGAYQPTAGLTVAVSNRPCDMGPGTPSNSGCYITLPGNNPNQLLVRVGSANGYLACKKPLDNNGYLYVNFAWTGYTNYGQPLTNFCIAKGGACAFQFRRDS